ncbi:MAG: hypothetical protein HY268_15475, partial [Deltaproteobacteria bacterium]|nr:hypothetical protein [Deltaproteobacteria bacterium]
TIRWVSVGVSGNVHIQLSRTGVAPWTTIIANTANDGQQTWIGTGSATTQGKIRVLSVGDSTIKDLSNKPFTIQ